MSRIGYSLCHCFGGEREGTLRGRAFVFVDGKLCRCVDVFFFGWGGWGWWGGLLWESGVVRSTLASKNTEESSEDINVDSIIERLIESRGHRPGRQVDLKEEEIRYLCLESRAIFLSQAPLVRPSAVPLFCLRFLLSPPFPALKLT